MHFWEKWKQKKSFETKFDELDAAVLTDKDLNNSKKVEQYVVERLEQIIDTTKEIEDEKAEYRIVTAYLNDIQKLEDLPEEERKKIADVALNVVQLNTARTGFLNSAKKISNAQFTQFEQLEGEIPSAVKRLLANEAYQATLKKDMRYLEREKSRWLLHREYLVHQQKTLKNFLYILVGCAAAAAVTLFVLTVVFKMDMFYAWLILIGAAAVSTCAVYLKTLRNASEITMAERSTNKAIVLLNKVKIKYVNITNAIDYACEKYHVRSAADLTQMWDYYIEAVREREKYQRTNEDLEYFNARLVRCMVKYQLYDAQVWINQAIALVDAKEMVEIKHGLINRRQKLRDRIEYNVSVIVNQKKEAEQLVDKVGANKLQIEEIIHAIDRLAEAL